MKVVVEPNTVGNAHVGCLVEMGKGFHQFAVITVEFVYRIILRADSVQDLLLRGILSTIGQHGRGDIDAEGRDDDILFVCVRMQAQEVQARLTLLIIEDLLLFCELQFLYGFRSRAAGSKHRCR